MIGFEFWRRGNSSVVHLIFGTFEYSATIGWRQWLYNRVDGASNA
jgi:hypothetical protein